MQGRVYTPPSPTRPDGCLASVDVLHEFNSCHNKSDGRFCSDPTLAGGLVSAVKRMADGGLPGSGYKRPVPIKARSIDEAVELILAGKVVELADTRAVNTVLSKLAAIANEAKALGKDAPDYDLCRVSVAGTNIFCGARVRTEEFPGGYPRIKMPQLSGVPRPGSPADRLSRETSIGSSGRVKSKVDGSDAFASYLQSIGIALDRTTVPAAKLRATQAELVGPQVAGMMTNAQYDPARRPIYVSRDHYILDGHHRWAAVVGRDAADNRLGDLRMKVIRVDAPISELLPLSIKWATKFGFVAKAARMSEALRELIGRLVPQSNGADLREFNPCHDPEDGRFAGKGTGQCSTMVGITSARPERGAGRQVFDDMREFAAELQSLPGVTHASVNPGLGAWEGGSEPTWVVSYHGNGAARRLLARTGQKFNQDGVLLMKPCRGRGCDPAAEIVFDRGVSGPVRQRIHSVLTERGISGWTWFKSSGRTVLRMVSVPAWGGERLAHLSAVRAISDRLRSGGSGHLVRVKSVKTSVMTRETYAQEIGGGR